MPAHNAHNARVEDLEEALRTIRSIVEPHPYRDTVDHDPAILVLVNGVLEGAASG